MDEIVFYEMKLMKLMDNLGCEHAEHYIDFLDDNKNPVREFVLHSMKRENRVSVLGGLLDVLTLPPFPIPVLTTSK